MEIIGHILFVALATGCIYGLIGLSFTAIFNASGVLNFAQGDLAMVGAITAFFALTQYHLPFVVTLLIVIVVAALFGLLIQYGVLEPLIARQASHIYPVLATIGAGMVISIIAATMTNFTWVKVPPVLASEPWRLGNIVFHSQSLLIIITTGVLVLGFWLFQKKTIYGMALRANGFNPYMAGLIGTSRRGMLTLAFIISAGISGIAGLLVAPIVTATYNMGLNLVLKGFVAAMLGGIGNPYGALAGGICLGLIVSSITYFSSTYAEAATFIVLLLVLTLRPTGFFGVRYERA